MECGVHAPAPRPSEAAITDYYAGAETANDWELEHYVEVPEATRRGDDRYLERIERLTGGRGALLEVGPAGGWLLDVARGRGWTVAGIEAAPKFQRYASESLGLDVRLGTVAEHAEAFESSVDVVVIRDVLEHLWDPVADLRGIRSMLKPGGWVLIETPNIASLMARFYGLKWRQIVCSHTFYWTPTSLRTAVSRAGLIPVQLSEPRYWDPDAGVQRRQHLRELAKLGLRMIGSAGFVGPSERYPAIRELPDRLSGGRVSGETLAWKIGDQPVLGDVLLCAAQRPRD